MERWVMLVSIVAALGFPVAVYNAVTSYHHLSDAKAQLKVLQMHDSQMMEFRQELSRYQLYQDRAQRFLKKAKALGIVPQVWDSRAFSVEGRMVSYQGLSSYIRSANHGLNYYFIPKKLELQTPEKAMKNKVSGSVFQYFDRSKPVLSLTIQGVILVKKQ